MKKIAISMILDMILCYGCSNGNSESDMTVGWQIIEEVQQSDVMQHEIVEEQEMEYKPVSAESSENMQEKEELSLGCVSIDQIEIRGRTDDETALIRKILSKNKVSVKMVF